MKRNLLSTCILLCMLTTPLVSGAATFSGLEPANLTQASGTYLDHRRPVRPRKLRRIPNNTRAVVYRTVSYYPVNGMFFTARKGVYVRSFPPVGFRIATRLIKPARLTVGGKRYWYTAGVFYQKKGREYLVVRAPIGVVVPGLPEDAAQVVWKGTTAFGLNGVVYHRYRNGYRVVAVM